jgi:hypothetical protein
MVLALVAGLTLPWPAQALSGMACEVQFLVNAKWSEPRTVGVEFMTGAELNKASGTFNFVAFKPYALIPMGVTDKAIVELDVPRTSGGATFSGGDLGDLFDMHHSIEGWQVNGRTMTKWSLQPQFASSRSRR